MISLQTGEKMKEKNNNRKQNLVNTFRTTKYMLGFVWKNGKLYVLMRIIMSVINTIFPLIYTIFPGLIIN